MDVKTFWITLLSGVAAISLLFGGLFWYNYAHFEALGGWKNHNAEFTAIAGAISLSWCASLFFWIFCVVTDRVLKFVLYGAAAVAVLVAAIEIAKKLL